MTVQRRFLFELLHVEAIAPRVDFPVDRGEVVAGKILAIFGELDRKTLERASVQPGKKSFDDGACLQLESTETRHHRRIEERPVMRGPGHGYIPLLGTGTLSSSRSMIASELIRSDS